LDNKDFKEELEREDSDSKEDMDNQDFRVNLAWEELDSKVNQV
jgi:hypothetical protein